MFDKNGFFKLPQLVELKNRVNLLKAEEAIKQEQENRQQWQKSDHTEQAQKTNLFISYIKELIKNRLTLDNILNGGALSQISALKDLYKDFKKLLNFDDFANLDQWQNKFNNYKLNYDFVIAALKSGNYDKIAPMHQYEKRDNKYCMIDKYKNDSFWGKNYLTEF